MTGLVLDDRFKEHQTGPQHAERPERIDAVRDGLHNAGLLEKLARIPVEPLATDLMRGVHDDAYLTRLEAACRDQRPCIDTIDSAICPRSYEIARLAAGGVVEAARRIANGELSRAFCAVRPPGHHCEVDRSMGFCLLANVALAARCLLDEFDLQRIAILDWDVHHGNGTQHIFEADPAVLFVSLHGHPRRLYPGTGFEHETGVGPGEGFTLNVPLMPGADDDTYRAAFESQVIPRIDSFKPQFLIISAGFDAHRDDPLAPMSVTDDGFEWMTRAALQLAQRHAQGRLLSVLEGGYDLPALSRCTARHVELLLAES